MQPIAIIGQACLFPGAPDVDTLWANLMAEVDAITQATEADWLIDPRLLFDPRKGVGDRISNLGGGWLRPPPFDATGYALPAEWLEALDPLFAWPLHTSREALRDAGRWRDGAAIDRCGVVVGAYSWSLTRSIEELIGPLYDREIEPALRELLGRPDFKLAGRRPTRSGAHPLNATIAGTVAMTLARALGLDGPRYSIDAACASIVYGLKLAALHLQHGHADTMIATAVSASDPVFASQGFSTLQALPTERSRPFDAASDGLAIGEGACAFVVRRLADAVRDGDRIIAVIRGIGWASDGRGQHIVTPNRKGQLEACARAYAQAGVSPAEIDYVECHATGTALGDRSEIDVIESLFADGTPPRIGSIKSNLGHLLTAAGGAGLIKITQSMRHGVIPPTIGIRKALQSPEGRVGGETIVRTPTAWPGQAGRPKRAALNAFGFGGTNAHLIVEEAGSTRSIDEAEASAPEPAAVIGMAGSFAGWQGLPALRGAFYEGRAAIRPPSPGRFGGVTPESTPPQGGYMDGFDVDLLRFRLPPRELTRLNPQQVLMLETADAALRDAGLQEGGRVAIVVGMGLEPIVQRLQERWDTDWRLRRSLRDAGVDLSEAEIGALIAATADGLHPAPEAGDFLGYVGNLLASRVTALWDFSGPAFTLSAEENSVFRALQVAEMLLQADEADAVLVAGIDLAGPAENLAMRTRFNAPGDGAAAFGFDKSNSGWLPGEGAGAIVLTNRARAVRDGRRIYGLVGGTSLIDDRSACQVEDGRLTTPSAASVTAAAQEALGRAGLSAADVGYVEAFASGNAAEDSAEMAGLADLFGAAGAAPRCGLGSVKALIGHTMAASGIAALLHALLALHERYIPPVANWAGPKDATLAGAPFFVAEAALPWLSPRGRRRAALLSGLGMDGSTSSVVLIEHEPGVPAERHDAPLPTSAAPLRVLAVAGDTIEELKANLEALQRELEGATGFVAIAAQYARTNSDKGAPRLAAGLVGSTREEVGREAAALRAALAEVAQSGQVWQTPHGSCFAPRPVGAGGKVAFVYSGLWAVDLDMGRELFRLLPAAHELLAGYADPEAALNIASIYPRGLMPVTPRDREELSERLQASPADLLKLGVVLPTLHTALLRDALGLQPDAILGYSLGELSMIHAAGAWPLDDTQVGRLLESQAVARLSGGLAAVRTHWGLADDQTPSWESHLLLAPRDAAAAEIARHDRVYLTHINTPMEIVIAGDAAQCRAVIDALGCDAVRVPSSLAIHCPPAAAERSALAALLETPLGAKPHAVPFFAATATDIAWTAPAIADGISRGFCQTLDFPSLVRRVFGGGARVFVEVGPGASCTRWIRDILADEDIVAVAASQRGVPDGVSLARLEAVLIAQRVPLEARAVPAVAAVRPRTRIELGGPMLTAPLKDPALRARLRHPVQPPPEKEVSNVRTLPAGPHRDALRAIVRNAEQRASVHGALIDLTTWARGTPALRPVPRAIPVQARATPIFDESAVMEFAEGRLERVFGEEWREIDGYARRLRLPSPPFMALSRVTGIEGKRGVLGSASIQTEFDLPSPAWYAVDGQAPYLALDAQGILMLVSWLGVDVVNRGRRYYRWLDATFTFLGDMPMEGETIRYDISLRRFAEAGDALLFFTDFDCTVSGRPMMRITDCCAGFFTAEELRGGQGITAAHRTLRPVEHARARPPVASSRESLEQADLVALARGEIGAVFGEGHVSAQANPALRLPPPAVQFIDHVSLLATSGGTAGIGRMVAEKQLDPTDWYIRTHFKDDPVYAGPCMLEGSRQALQVFMLACGMHRSCRNARFQPLLDQPTTVKFRGQVPGEKSVFTYHVDIVGLGLEPEPWVIADIDFIHGGRTIGRMEGLGMRIASS